MKLEIKKALLEGHTPEVIVEAYYATDESKQVRNFLPTTLIPAMAFGGAVGGGLDSLNNSNSGIIDGESDNLIDGALFGAGIAAPIGAAIAHVEGSDAAFHEAGRRSAHFNNLMKARQARAAKK